MDPTTLGSLLGRLDPSKGEYEGWTFVTEPLDPSFDWVLSSWTQPPPPGIEFENIASNILHHQELSQREVENWREGITDADRTTIVGHLVKELRMMEFAISDETIERTARSLEHKEIFEATSREEYMKRIGRILLKINENRWQKFMTGEWKELFSNSGDNATFIPPQQQLCDKNMHLGGASSGQDFDWKSFALQIQSRNPPTSVVEIRKRGGEDIPQEQTGSDAQERVVQPFTNDTVNKPNRQEKLPDALRGRVDEDLQRKSNQAWIEIEQMRQKYKKSFIFLSKLIKKSNTNIPGVDEACVRSGLRFCSKVLFLKRESLQLSTWDSQSIARIARKMNRLFMNWEPGIRILVRLSTLHPVHKRALLAHLATCSGGTLKDHSEV